MKEKLSLTIGLLYPDLMSTYGDRGNIICLGKRLGWRGIGAAVLPIDVATSGKEIEACDMVIGGGAQDKAQELIIEDLRKHKKRTLKKMFGRGIPGLFVCGSPQLLGAYYTTAEGKRLEGLGIFDFCTVHPGPDVPRCIGNTAGEILSHPERPEGVEGSRRMSDSRTGFFASLRMTGVRRTIVGFENHGGRTYLGKGAKPFAKVLRGFGNNGEDGYEGAIYKNVIACYYHGPFLPKNPHVADWLIAAALAVKHGKEIQLAPLDDTMEWQAHEQMLKKMGL